MDIFKTKVKIQDLNLLDTNPQICDIQLKFQELPNLDFNSLQWYFILTFWEKKYYYAIKSLNKNLIGSIYLKVQGSYSELFLEEIIKTFDSKKEINIEICYNNLENLNNDCYITMGTWISCFHQIITSNLNKKTFKNNLFIHTDSYDTNSLIESISEKAELLNKNSNFLFKFITKDSIYWLNNFEGRFTTYIQNPENINSMLYKLLLWKKHYYICWNKDFINEIQSFLLNDLKINKNFIFVY